MPPEALSDDGLVRRLAARDGRAWEAFMDRYGGLIEAVCQRALASAGRTADAGSVADAAADVLRALLEDDCRLLRHHRPGTPLGAYLRVIARTRTLNALRRGRPAPVPDGILEAAQQESRQQTALETAERIEGIRRALSALPERDAEALRLFHLDGLPYAGIAGRLGIPPDQVGPVLLRAREKMRGILGESFLESA